MADFSKYFLWVKSGREGELISGVVDAIVGDIGRELMSGRDHWVFEEAEAGIVR